MTILLVERIGVVNQYVKLLAEAYQSRGHEVIFDVQNFLFSDFLPDVVHVQWPEAIYDWRHSLPKDSTSLDFIRNRLSFYKNNRIPIVYTAHNLLPHKEVSFFDEEVYQSIINAADIIVHHGQESIRLLKKDSQASVRHIICPHGPYPYSLKDRKAARKRYKLSENRVVFLNFGVQRENKGFKFLRNVFGKWPGRKKVLWTVGPKRSPKGRKLYGIVSNLVIRLRDNVLSSGYNTDLREVKNEEIPYIMAATDIVVLGNQTGLNSGLVCLAASYSKPVVFPNLGNFEYQLNSWPWKYNYEAGDIPSAIQALQQAKITASQIKSGELKVDNSNWLENNSWDKHVTTILVEVEKMRRSRQ